jgi:endonuclease YncB( thermonuclease family)
MLRAMRMAVCALLVAAGSATYATNSHVGVASVIDGDTLDLHGTRIRLWGIDAPEGRQMCQRDGQPWRCGQAAALALSDRIGRRPVHCEARETDRWGRLVAICRQGGEDLSEWMVRGGLALAFRRYAVDYVQAEDDARAGRRGLWASAFAPPWAWRRDREAPMVTASAE